MSADIAPPQASEDGVEREASAERGTLSLDDLRHRLDSPLFARDPALAAPAQVPRLRELTWEHVVNPTSSIPIVPSDEPSADGADPTVGAAPKSPKPLKIEDLLAAPADPFSVASRAMPSGEQPAQQTMPAAVDPAPAVEAESASSTVEDAPVVRERPAAPALPSFAAMLSGEVAEVDTPTEVGGVDGLVKPIEERPPVARDTDPEIAGLAELIVRATPVTGMPRVEAVRDSLRGDTGSVPVVVVEDAVVAETPAVVGFAPPTPAGGVGAVPAAPPSQQVPAVLPPPVSGKHATVDGARPVTGVQPAVAMSAVEAELNRLAYLPDQEEDLGPVEVPEIVYSDVRSAEPVPAAPVLSNAELYAPRQSAAPVRHAYTDIVEKATPPPRRRKRHVLRKIVTFVVLAGMVAGGLFAVKYFVLDKVKWADDIAPLAVDVETARALKFDHDIPVTELAGDEYATKIAETVHGITDENRSAVETSWRALGVLTGALDTQAIGRGALVDSPAFYDGAADAIYVLQGLDPEVRTFALHRALTMALLDQRFGWSARIATASPAVAAGTRALYDADALAVAQSLLTDEDRTAVADQLYALVRDNAGGATPSPFASYAAGRAGLALWTYFDAQSPQQRDLLETEAAVTDAQLLDLRRLTSGSAESAGDQAQGMLFWYHVLAARLDDDLAWNAALGWRGDEVSASGSGGTCVTGTIRIDDAHSAVAVAAFDAWAAAAPPESTTAVSSVPGQSGAPTAVTVTACDPGEAVPTNDSAPRLSLGGAPLRIEQYRRLMDSDDSLTPREAACAVYAGTDALTGDDERGMVDPVDGWTRPDSHPLPDPVASGCATP
ncbi:MAG: hypothetical protein HY828_09835 [Actinobacteria bacterium]|nr:hypothetical protein [Actinomycetota bacterium]